MIYSPESEKRHMQFQQIKTPLPVISIQTLKTSPQPSPLGVWIFPSGQLLASYLFTLSTLCRLIKTMKCSSTRTRRPMNLSGTFIVYHKPYNEFPGRRLLLQGLFTLKMTPWTSRQELLLYRIGYYIFRCHSEWYRHVIDEFKS